MPLKYDYRTLVKTVPAGTGFDPADANKSGELDITDFGGGDKVWKLFVPHVIVSWSVGAGPEDQSGVDSVDFRFVDEANNSIVCPVHEDTPGVASFESFTWPDGGHGFPVPKRVNLDRAYLMHLTTAASGDDAQVWTVQLWWEPKFPEVGIMDAIACFGAKAIENLGKGWIPAAVQHGAPQQVGAQQVPHQGNVSPQPGVFVGQNPGPGKFGA